MINPQGDLSMGKYLRLTFSKYFTILGPEFYVKIVSKFC